MFLFNDILVITKIHSRKKNMVTYTFRQNHILAGLTVSLFDTPYYPFGIQVVQKRDRKVVLTLNARNEHDRSKFVEDLKESIAEMDEMEALRLESELEKQRLSLSGQQMPVVISSNGGTGGGGGLDKRDSGITDNETSSSVMVVDPNLAASARLLDPTASSSATTSAASNGGSRVVLRKSAINNSLLDLTDVAEKMARRGSVGSLDSGMSISFQSSSQLATAAGGSSSRQSSSTGVNQNQQHNSSSSREPSFNNHAKSFSTSKKRSFSGSGGGSRGGSVR